VETKQTEPTISLPGGTIFAAIIAITIVVPAIYALIALLAGWEKATIEAAGWGAALAGGIASGATLVMGPWKSRTINSWMTFWLGATVLRLFITPALAWLLYSATSLHLEALCLSVATTYFLTVLTEAWIIARHVRKVLPPR
jgi:hypothetical protein